MLDIEIKFDHPTLANAGGLPPFPSGAGSSIAAGEGPVNPPDWSVLRLAQLRPPRMHKDGRAGYKMPGGYWASEEAYKYAFARFWQNVKTLHPGRLHTVESMCDDPRWERRAKGTRIAIGRCFKYLADNGVLPIMLVGDGMPLKYLLLSDQISGSAAH